MSPVVTSLVNFRSLFASGLIEPGTGKKISDKPAVIGDSSLIDSSPPGASRRQKTHESGMPWICSFK